MMNQEVKTRIIVVATDCFRKYGIKNTSMECVASSVGISKRTLYQCFSSKRVLLAECVRVCVEENREQIRRRIAGKGCMEAMVGMCNVVYGLLTSLYPAFRKDVVRYGEVLSLLRESYRTPLYEQGFRLFEQAKGRGFVLQGSDFRFVFSFFENCLLSFSADVQEDKVQAAAYSHTLLTYLAGICTYSGREQLNHISMEVSYEKD